MRTGYRFERRFFGRGLAPYFFAQRRAILGCLANM